MSLLELTQWQLVTYLYTHVGKNNTKAQKKGSTEILVITTEPVPQSDMTQFQTEENFQQPFERHSTSLKAANP